MQFDQVLVQVKKDFSLNLQIKEKQQTSTWSNGVGLNEYRARDIKVDIKD